MSENPAVCICTDSCPEDASENPCRPCRTMDPYEPCPVIGFGCGSVPDEPCDCCTEDQRKAAALTGPRMTPEQLASIQARADTAEAKRAQSRRNPGPIFDAAMMLAIQASSADVPAILALVREQAAKLDKYEAKHGEHTTDNQGRGCPACAAAIRVKARERAALTATEGA